MTENEFLEHNIFNGLTNLNTGHDSETMWHFSVEDFREVMSRADEYKVRILGIECWEKEDVKHTLFYEDYDTSDWHLSAYQELLDKHAPCIFTATFEVPAIYLKDHLKD